MNETAPRGARVLVVDDDEVDRMVVTRALVRIGAELVVTEASTAAAALAAIDVTPFDCVLSDLHMPGDDGAWLLRQMRVHGHDVPFVVLTGQGDERTAVALMKAGAADYVSKDAVSPERLAVLLHHVIRLHHVEREARLYQERLALALEATGLGTWDFDLSANTLSCDARCRAIYAIGPDDDLGDGSDQIHPDDREEVRARIARAMDPDSDGRYRSDHRTSAGRGDRWVRIEGQVYFSERRPVRFIGTAQDISQVRAEEVAVQRRLEFEQQLIGIVSHDLRNPVSAMIMGARLLREWVPADTPLASVAGRIVSSGERATRLIHDLLDFTQARIGLGIPIRPCHSDIHQVCRQVVDELVLNHPTRHVVFERDGDGSGSWDPDRIGQAIGNLVRNAISYSPDGSEVTVRTVGSSDHVAIEVHNLNVAGPVAETVRATLFQPFQRGDRTHDSDRSIGLGLFIVSEIVAAHGGTVELRSDLDGTTFRVILPRSAGGPP